MEELKERARKLWKRFDENGGRITKSEASDVIGVHYYNQYRAFKKHGIDAPILADSRIGALKEKADKLNNAGKEVLNTQEVKDLLELKRTSDSKIYYKSIAKHFKVPELIGVREARDIEEEIAMRSGITQAGRDSFYTRHPSGLRIMSARELPDGRVAYELR